MLYCLLMNLGTWGSELLSWMFRESQLVSGRVNTVLKASQHPVLDPGSKTALINSSVLPYQPQKFNFNLKFLFLLLY